MNTLTHTRHLLTFGALGICLSVSVWAQESTQTLASTSTSTVAEHSQMPASTEKDVQKQRPKIGLALSGGGARGLAHIGVLRALEEQHIPIDYIAGTSAGALIGGMYASGMSVDEIERRVESINFEKILFGKADRRTQTQFTRDIEYQGNGMVDLSITRGGAIALPKAVIDGARVEEALRDILKDHPYQMDFDHLPIPFRAVASDLSTGQKVVLNKGILAHALRASMSIPAVFSPVEINGQLLTDGMVASNLPINVVREMGADRIIAIDVGSGLLSKDKIKNVVNVSEQLLSILVERNVTDEVKTLSNQDLYVKVDVGDIGNLQFNRIDEALKHGYDAMKQTQVAQQSSTMSVPTAQYDAFVAQHQSTPTKPKIISFVRVETNGLANPEALQNIVQVRAGKPLDMDAVKTDIKNLLNIDRIESVQYDVLPVGNGNELVYYVREKDIAKNVLRAGIEMSSSSLTNQKFSLHLAHRNIWLNSFGAEWRSYLTLGNNTQLKTEFNQPLSSGHNWYIRPKASFTVENNSAYLAEQNKASTDYDVRRQNIGLQIGQAIGSIGEWGVGASWQDTRLKANYTNLALPIQADHQKRLTIDAEVTFDQLDDFYIPTQGYYTKLYASTATKKTNNNRYLQAGIHSIWAKRMGQNSWVVDVEAAGHNNSGSVYTSPYRLGGYHRLSGYEQNQFIGNYLLFGSLSYRYLSPWKMLNEPLILGASLESGNTWNRLSDIGTKDLKVSGSLFGAINTPIGPAQIGIGITRKGHANVYFYLGRTVSDW
jgi:NTE family protein